MNRSENQNRNSQNLPTVLFVEIVGLSAMSVKLPFDKFNSLMNECFEFVLKKIELYGGTVSSLDGENIKAVFGLPDYFENAAENSIKAAVDLIERFKLFNQINELSIPIFVRIGIETGPVILSKVENGEHSQYNIFGETVSTASRIRDLAENDQILVGPNLYAQTKGQFEFFPLEPVPVKGQKEPMSVFELIRKKEEVLKPELSSGRMISSEMVGRQAEIEKLQNGVFNLLNQKGSIINIIGKAGIGKSRLMAEIRGKELLKKVAFFEGRALSNGKNLSYYPIIQIIKSWAGISEENSTEESKSKLESNIRRIYPEAFYEIFPFIATMMGYRLEGKAKERLKDIEGEALENLILKNMRDLLTRAASIRPVIIVIEDAHWCDISSIIFMESLFKLVQKQRILFVNVFRPGYKETGERIQKFLNENLKDHHQEISIEPLTTRQSDELIDNLLQKVKLPDEINSLIIERAAGNPFFIEEVIRSFIDEGLIIIENNRFILTDNIKYANIPESIDNIILSRIDRLDGKTKELLKTASVIGRNFYFKVLEEAAQTIEEVDDKLEYLKDVQLINERKQKDEVEFLFKHALAQQATYDSIVEKSRKDLHLKIARSIEKVFAGRIHEFYGTLAHHYSKAGQQDKTEEYLIKAGDESMKSGAASEAVILFKQALKTHLQIYRDNPDQQRIIDLQEKLAFAFFATGQFVEAVDYFDKVIAFYYKPFPKSETRKIIDLVYNLLLGLNIIYFYKIRNTGEVEEVGRKILKIMEKKGKALVSVDPKRLFLESFYGYRFVNKNKFGNYEASVFLSTSPSFFYSGILFKYGKKIMEFGERHIDREYLFGWMLGKFARCMYTYYTGNKIEIQEEEKVYQVGIQSGQYFPITVFYLFGGFNFIESGNEKLALHYLQRLTGVSDAFDNNFTIAQFHRLNTVFNLKFRKIEETLKVSEEGHEMVRKTDHYYVLITFYCFRSMAFSFRQDYDEARNILSEAEKLLKKHNTAWYISYYLTAKSYVEIAELKVKTTDKSAGKLVLNTTKDLIHHSQKVRKNLPEAYRLRARVYWLLNKPNKALRNFEKSIKISLSFDGKLELSRTWFEVGKFLCDPKNKKTRLNGMSGTECLMKAKAMFEEMNLEWDLKEYEKYMKS